jgi:hypothetical protein
MKLTRSHFLAAGIPLLLCLGASPPVRVRRRRRLVLQGVVTEVDAKLGRFSLRPRSGKGSRDLGAKVLIWTNENTLFVFPDESEGAFEDLDEAVKVTVRGRLNQGGSLEARRVLINVDDLDEEEIDEDDEEGDEEETLSFA